MSSSLSDAIKAATEQIRSANGDPPPEPSAGFRCEQDEPIVVELVYSFLLWESDRDSAAGSFASLREQITGLNELRVCDAEEVASMLPRGTPRREERAARLVAALNAVFEREHALSLAALSEISKREARQYLDALDGMHPFVAARVVLIALGGHAMPADDRIAEVLAHRGVIDDLTLGHAELSAQLERAVRAADARQVYAVLETDAVRATKRSRTKGRTAKRTPAKRSRKTKAEP